MNHILKIKKQSVINNIKTCAGDKQVCLMVKANCYGVGDEGIKLLIDLGYTFFGVSTIEEALNIRKMSKSVKILIVSYIDIADISVCIDNNITFTVYDFNMLDSLNAESIFHLKVDTNMGRLGFQMDELESVRDYLVNNNLKPEGIFSHLACASNNEKTQLAITNFEQALDIFKQFEFDYIHLLNTYGSLNYNTKFDNLVRIGIGIWGYLADQSEAKTSRKQLEPALELDLTISHVKEYKGFVSYDHIDHVDGTILTVPIGYNDGFNRSFHGYKLPGIGQVVGNVNMCQHMILVNENNTRNYSRGQYITLFAGEQLYDLCEYTGQTTYEQLTSLSERIKRVID